MAHLIEERNGVYSFVENGRKERAWHGLGQVFDGQLTVKEALELSHADYQVEMTQVFALTPALQQAMEQGVEVDTDLILDAIVKGRKATMRMDDYRPLGIVSDSYGVVQNRDAFQFIDTLCTGGNGENTPVIECAGVLGNGERGTAMWALNGLTTYYQNVANYRNDEVKLNSVLAGNAAGKLQKAYDLLVA